MLTLVLAVLLISLNACNAGGTTEFGPDVEADILVVFGTDEAGVPNLECQGLLDQVVEVSPDGSNGIGSYLAVGVGDEAAYGVAIGLSQEWPEPQLEELQAWLSHQPGVVAVLADAVPSETNVDSVLRPVACKSTSKVPISGPMPALQ